MVCSFGISEVGRTGKGNLFFVFDCTLVSDTDDVFVINQLFTLVYPASRERYNSWIN